MISLSLCMIVKNEEKTLNKCLDSVKELFDEIVIVDTGSEDNTKDIAKKYTNNIFDFMWCDDFAKARNFSFSKATEEYIMWLDADDIVLEKDLKKLFELKENLDENIDMIMLKYNLNLDEYGNPALSYYRERIVKNNKKHVWISPIHEVIIPSGNIVYKNIAITHNKSHSTDSTRNLKIFEKMKKNRIQFDARQTFYYARELYYDKQYEKAISTYNNFLNMKDAWSENIISACIDLNSIYLIKKNYNKALKSLLRSLEFAFPTAEICCHIGNIFIIQKKFKLSIYWYKEALNKKYDDTTGGFFCKDYYDFIPYLQLCVCHFNLGDIKSAIYYNNLAGSIKPNDTSYLQNTNFFNSLNNYS